MQIEKAIFYVIASPPEADSQRHAMMFLDYVKVCAMLDKDVPSLRACNEKIHTYAYNGLYNFAVTLHSASL